MPLDVNRWLKYAKARIESAVGQGNATLDRLEAEREAELADRPWLRSDGEAPTLDEARARIEWEARRQAEGGGSSEAPPSASPPGSSGSAGSGSGTSAEPAGDAAAASARLQMEERQRASSERLAEIRKELGVEEPVEPAAGDRPPVDEGDPPAVP